MDELIPVAVRPKAWVYSRSTVRIADSNPAEGIDICCVCCVGNGLCDGLVWLLVPSNPTRCVHLCVIYKPQQLTL